MANQQNCILCGSSSLGGARRRRGPWNYVQCRDCGAVSLDPIPEEAVLHSYYKQVYSVPMEAYARGVAEKVPAILTALKERFPGAGKLLEIGCSYGFLLKVARQEGWDTTGIELDDQAVQYGREKLGLKILPGTLESEAVQLEPPYDAIATFHVIEHVRDPIEFLRRCRELLSQNGLLILKTPNVASWIAARAGSCWQWLCPPAHIHLFAPRTLEMALQKCGFQVERLWSQRGDAHNNLFELVCAMGRYVASRGKGNAEDSGERKSWGDRWQVNVAKAVSEAVYYPLGLAVDPWLGKKGLQPELVAIARGSGNEYHPEAPSGTD